MNIDNSELRKIQSAYKLIVESNNEDGDSEMSPVDKLEGEVGSYTPPHKKGSYGNPLSDEDEGPTDDQINMICDDLKLGITADEIHNHPDKEIIEKLIEALLYKRAEADQESGFGTEHYND